MTKTPSFFLFIFGVIIFHFAPVQSIFGQGEDLTLPGDEAPVVVNTDPAETTESGEDSAPGREKQNLFEMVKDGGWAMYPLFAMLFAVIALSVFLMLDLKKSTFAPVSLSDSLLASAQAGDLNAISEHARNSASCLGQVMNGACEYIYDRGYQVLDGDSILDLMADASQEFNRRRVSLLNYLSVISQAAPMVGLLGTVSGMIKAFQTLNQTGMGDPGALAGNISEALVTTASGLIVALPAIFVFFFLRDRLISRVAEVDKHCFKTLTALRRAVIGAPGQKRSGGQSPPPQQEHPSA